MLTAHAMTVYFLADGTSICAVADVRRATVEYLARASRTDAGAAVIGSRQMTQNEIRTYIASGSLPTA